MGIVNEQCAHRSRRPFATLKLQRYRPDVTRNDTNHRDCREQIIAGKMPHCPQCQRAFGEISKNSNDEARSSQRPPDVASPDATAPLFTDILASARSYEVVTRRETTQRIRA